MSVPVTATVLETDQRMAQVKPHGAIYGQTARSLPLAQAAVEVCKAFSTPEHKVAFMGLAGTAHQQAAEEAGVPFIAGQDTKELTEDNGTHSSA